MICGRSSNRGLTIVEVVVMVAVLGIMALSIPITLRLLNTLKYQQQIAQTNTEARLFIRQLLHEVRSAEFVNVFENPDFATNPRVTQCLSIIGYNYDRYTSPTGTFEDSNMFFEFVGGYANLKRTYYCVVQEVLGLTFDQDGSNGDSYIVKITMTPTYLFGSPALSSQLINLINPIAPGELSNALILPTEIRAQVYFKNMLRLDNGVDMFEMPGQAETVRTELHLYPSFQHHTAPARIYQGMTTMRNKNGI